MQSSSFVTSWTVTCTHTHRQTDRQTLTRVCQYLHTVQSVADYATLAVYQWDTSHMTAVGGHVLSETDDVSDHMVLHRYSC